ncbi:MAG: HAMP domain-containing sensor histidine kinase [bacterium]
MSPTPSSPRRRSLAIGFVAAAVPLLLLLGLQWVWLDRLEGTTRIAREAARRNVEDAISGAVESFYRETAQQALAPPPGSPRRQLREEFTRHWSRRPVEGARALFLVDYETEPFGNVLRWDSATSSLVSPPASDEALAIIVACTPWQVASYHRRAVEMAAPLVDERDPQHRIILLPLLDEESHVLAVSGMVLDEEYFTDRLVPRVVADARTEGLAVEVRDVHGHAAFSAGRPGSPPAAARRLSWVYTDWTLTVSNASGGAERWARASFAFNMSLAVLLAAALLGGILFALRAASRAVQLSDMKSDFVSNVSHELRTPLASIRAFGELLRLGRASPEKVREYGAHIENESRRLSGLIDNLLDFSRIESGRKEYGFVPARLEDVVTKAIEAFEVRTRDAGFRIEYLAPGSPLPELVIDPDAVGQAVHNLLDNAVKYSGESRRIEVALGVDGAWAVCAVRDWGVGIPREEQRRVFERFHRVGSVLVHDVKGAGLGLSIVQHVVRAHGGEAWIESEPGQGTTVRLRLPLGGARPAPATTDASAGAGR